MKIVRTHLLFFLSVLTQVIASAQSITFNKVLPPKGKTFEHVTGMVQDGQGYMWLATKRGVFRYDGYQMTSYKNNPLDENSFVADALEAITVDLKGNIWIGTPGFGLDRYDPFTGVFTHFRHQINDPATLGSDYIFALLVDREGVLWIGTSEGLSRYDASTGKFKHYRHLQNDSTSISNNEVIAIYEDRKGELWIGTGSVYGKEKDKLEAGGLNRFNKETGTFTRYLHNPKDPHSLVSNKVKAIFEDSKGNFWVGTAGDGLHTMDRAKGTFQRHRYDPAFPERLSRPPLSKLFAQFDHITFIKEDASGAIWIGTTESGLNYYNPSTGKVTHYESQKDTTGAFINRTAWAAHTSRDGVVWISTLEGSLYTINPVKWNIPFYQSTNGGINTFYEERDGNLWIGTDNRGLIRNNSQKGIIKHFVHDAATPSTINNNSVQAIIEDHKGNIWIGTNGGLELFNKQKETFTHYRHDARNNNTLGNNHVTAIYEDSHANLWVGTLRGLNRMNPSTRTFTHYIFYPEDTSFFGSNTITSILEDRQGQIWVSSAQGGGVQRLNPINGKFKDYLKGNGIINILEDAKGTLWVAGNNLYHLNSKNDTFYHFVDPVLGIEINSIRSFLQDDKGIFWLGNSDGILKLDRQRNEFMLYGPNYGVNANGLVFGASYKGRNGKLYFGHDDGYYAFIPSDLTKEIKPPQIVLSDFRLANQLVKPGKNSPLPRPLSQLKKINLRYNQNVFSFDFATIDYTNPGSNRHLFMLENYDNEWRQSGAEHRAYYFNIPPGHYTFQVKGANSYGIWAQKSIEIIITPPWWRTWWAYSLFGALFIAMVWGFIYYRSIALRRENRLLEEKVARRTEQLNQSLENLKAAQAQLIQSEKMASLGELTAGIAHEIQNPLNFVNNFAEMNTELIDDLKKELNAANKEAISIADNLKENEAKIIHHGKRADAIVKGMLQHSRVNTGQKQSTDINALADEYLRLAYHGMRAKDKSFNADIKTDFDPAIGKINVVPQDVGRVLLNLYNNAFYAVTEKKKEQSEGYEPMVSVSTKKINSKVEIKVADNGNGIPQKVLDKIFQPFFTTKPTGQGTGLGLSLAYDIIKAHGGEIKVESKEGEGAEFTVQLPINNSL